MRVALLCYRGNPYSGGQGVYIRNLSRELAALGHRVEVLAGQPYPILDEGVAFTPLPSLDLYRQPDPFRTPRPGEYRDSIDLLEVATMWTAGFPEPRTFSLRAARHLASRRGEFDVVHDNQCLGSGLLRLPRLGLPTLATVHHPVQVDRDLELAEASGVRRVSLRRWYGFTRMQARVARRLPEIITVSASSAAQITEYLGVRPQRITTIPIGTDVERFRPDPAVPKVPGRIVTTASADSPLKGLAVLVEAFAKVRAEHDHAQLVVVGAAKEGGAVRQAIERYGLEPYIRFVSGLSEDDLIALLRSAQVACVPSLYEGFSLPAVEAMAVGLALVSTTGGAIPEVAGADGETTLAVPPGDAPALAAALTRLLGDEALRGRLAAAARERAVRNFTWRAAAAATAQRYRALIEQTRGNTAAPGLGPAPGAAAALNEALAPLAPLAPLEQEGSAAC
ncbi:glycosyltransferase family 4 protein [Actinocrinis puniceicyclus]|uniref:Glycosyltransferase family 4 protein n=1 Tax=Actinocrinis puniceicyclus TaxID=977794 RepID=A0A8J7WSH4_9ACTN|nr:glycosyltransferase family 4 protein [Actinocrinis puniceicyclus]